ncbi:MAG: FecR domain-containing protein [Acidobacteria bacterium]|nr:FecR domain-containing protein [Acidobacteriota bacterium]
MDEQPQKQRFGGLEVYWTTVTYRSLLFVVLALLLAGISITILLRPGILEQVMAKLTSKGNDDTSAVEEAAQARFINLDGTVRVKGRDSSQWVNADYRIPLEEGDIIQTGPQGIARITFIDGTTYVVKPNTLIVIEENIALKDRTTRVAVQVTSGAVDLSTGSWEPGSSSVIRFSDAEARMGQNTRAAVTSNPKTQVNEITVAEGSALVSRRDQSIQVGPYERASFRSPDDSLTKEQVLAPPTLLRPRNLEPIISANPRQEVVRFTWSRVAQANRYRLRLSTSPLLTSTVLDRTVQSSSFRARGLQPGDYYWTVTAFDEKGQESQQSPQYRFSLFEQPASEELLLVIDNVVQHGRHIEIIGRTEAGAMVTINAEPVANVRPDGSFRHFIGPLASAGAHSITIVAQNRRGEVVTRKKTVVVQ